MRERTSEQTGRRVAARPARGAGALAALGVVLPAAFGLLAWVGATQGPPAAEPGHPTVGQVAVDTVSVLCPGAAGSGASVRVARADLGTDQPEAARLLSGTPQDLDASTDLPLGRAVRLDPVPGPSALRVEGEGAPGVLADVVLADASGLAAASCPAPATVWWFTGAGAGVAHRSALNLTNLEQGPAVVDVRLYGVDGPLPVDSLRGVTLAPEESRTWSWADVAPGQEVLTVEVRVVRGRVVATSQDESDGREWVAAAAPPATRQQVPAVPAGPGRSVLTVTNPGASPTLVTVRVVTTSGAFVPLDLGETFVEPGAVVALDLSGAIDGEAAAIEVTADAAVVAGLRKTVGTDAAAAPATPPLEGPGAVGTGPGRTVLHLSAGDEAVTTEVRAVAASGEVLAQERLGAGRSSLVTWAVPPRAAYVVVVPTRGTPYAAVVRGGGTGGVTVVPVATLPWERTVPEVLPQPAS